LLLDRSVLGTYENVQAVPGERCLVGTSFKFSEFDRGDDSEEKVGTWVIETPECVFRGDLFLS